MICPRANASDLSIAPPPRLIASPQFQRKWATWPEAWPRIRTLKPCWRYRNIQNQFQEAGVDKRLACDRVPRSGNLTPETLPCACD